MDKIIVLYEDNHLIAVVKPAGVLAQADASGDESMLELVKGYLKEEYHKPGQVFLGLLHRLDRPVSGIMLFAKTSKGASRLSEQFRNHEVEKIYHALVIGKPEEKKGALVDYLEKGKNQKSKGKNQNFKSKVKSFGESGKEAVLYYEVVESSGRYSLLKIQLGTGRFHQIRAQLSAAGFPIVGDVKYQGPPWSDSKAIALCATGLAFTTATDEKRISLSLEMPKFWETYLSTGKA